MARLIQILAASVGGGLVLGAGIRLGEAFIAGGAASARETEPDSMMAARLRVVERRLMDLETGIPKAPTENQAVRVEAASAVASQPGAREEIRVDAPGDIVARLRGELLEWLDENVAVRMAEVETKLRTESENSREQMLDAILESVQTRVMHRIAKLESEVAGQSAAMTELRECSLRTEQSMQKLLGGLDRLILAQQPTSGRGESGIEADIPSGVEPAAKHMDAPGPSAPPPEPPEPLARPPQLVVESQSRPRRWNIFG